MGPEQGRGQKEPHGQEVNGDSDLWVGRRESLQGPQWDTARWMGNKCSESGAGMLSKALEQIEH